jgi:hypothetical protein
LSLRSCATVEHNHLVDEVQSFGLVGDQQHGTVSGRREHFLEQALGGRRVEVSRRLIELFRS